MKGAILTVGILLVAGIGMLIGYSLGSPAPEPGEQEPNKPENTSPSTHTGTANPGDTGSRDGATDVTNRQPAGQPSTARQPRPPVRTTARPQPKAPRRAPSIPTPPPEAELQAFADKARETFTGTEWEVGGNRIRFEPDGVLTIGENGAGRWKPADGSIMLGSGERLTINGTELLDESGNPVRRLGAGGDAPTTAPAESTPERPDSSDGETPEGDSPGK